jgi:transcriptional regulator with GAF, ATPase, and Fis domain
MAPPTTSRNYPSLETSVPAGAVPVASLPCSEDLQGRPSRPPDYEKENRALVELVSALAGSPTTIFQTLVETIQDITQSDTAGLSLLTRDDNTPDPSGKRFYWPAITGMWKSLIGGGTSRDSTPCGDVVDQNRAMLFRHFQRCYPYFLTVIPLPEEALLAPFHIAGTAVGTIWAVMHSDRRQFDAEDDRVMASLGKFASSAFQALKHIGDLKIQTAEREKAEAENIALLEEINQASMFEEIIGSSGTLRKVLLEVAKVAPTDSTVLIMGETGTGKELVARAIHKRSKRSGRAFIRVNCAAIPASLIASELFGHEKGAFTGALQRRAGHFEAANGGTIFLDEIGELSLETQISLLRVLQEREFQRVGSSQPVSVDVRVLAATNRDLDAAVAAGTFRQDLLYRLNVFPICVPPLRARKNDIPLLVQYLVEQFARETGKRINEIQKKTLSLFQAYDWPGNIRELQNVIERAVILSDGNALSVDETWLQGRSNNQLPRPMLSPVGMLADDRIDFVHRERKTIEGALAACEGRVSGPYGAAAKLGIPRQTLDSKIVNLGIDKRRFKVLSPRRRPA